MLASEPRRSDDITINQGADLQLQIFIQDSTGTAINLTGYSLKAEIRTDRDSTFIEQSLTTAIINASGGELLVSLTNAETKALDFGNNTYFWDLLTTDTGGIIRREVEGKARLSKDITE